MFQFKLAKQENSRTKGTSNRRKASGRITEDCYCFPSSSILNSASVQRLVGKDTQSGEMCIWTFLERTESQTSQLVGERSYFWFYLFICLILLYKRLQTPCLLSALQSSWLSLPKQNRLKHHDELQSLIRCFTERDGLKRSKLSVTVLLCFLLLDMQCKCCHHLTLAWVLVKVTQLPSVVQQSFPSSSLSVVETVRA